MQNLNINIEQTAQNESRQNFTVLSTLRLQDLYPLPRKFFKLEKGVWLDIFKVYKSLKIKAYSFHNFKSVLYERHIFERDLILDLKNDKVLIFNTLEAKGGVR